MNGSPLDSQAMDKPQASSFTWTIENFSRLRMKKLYSDSFTVGGYKWRILIFPKGNQVDCLSVYLDVADSATLPYGWSRRAAVDLLVVDQVRSMDTIKKETEHLFNQRESDWGFTSFMSLSELYDPSKGYIINDTCVIEANVRVIDDTKKEESDASQKSPPTGSLTLNPQADESSSDTSIPGQNRGAVDPSGPIEIDDKIRDLFMDMDDLVDAVVVKPATSNQARKKLKALLALDLGDVAERRGEIIGWASVLASTSDDMKKLLRDLVTTTVFESFLLKKAEAADLEQKLSKRRVLAEAFVEMPKALESLKTDKQLADGNVSEHERIIKECEDETENLQKEIENLKKKVENLQKKIAHHKEQLLEARHLAEESKETFQAERDKAAKLKEELVATKDTATSWKEAHAEALAKAEELKREWSILVQNIVL